MLAPYHDRVRREIESFGGVVEKFIGDAVMGVFGAPLAHGDDAERAVRAALVVRDSAGELAGGGLQIRIAVNTGEAVVSLGARPALGESMVAGDVVNTASRLQAAAPVNGVVVGAETYLTTKDAIAYEQTDPVIAKGKEHPVRAWIALHATTVAGQRPLSSQAIVGRGREIAHLRRALAARRRRTAASSRFRLRPGRASASRRSQRSSAMSSTAATRASSTAVRCPTARAAPTARSPHR